MFSIRNKINTTAVLVEIAALSGAMHLDSPPPAFSLLSHAMVMMHSIGVNLTVEYMLQHQPGVIRKDYR